MFDIADVAFSGVPEEEKCNYLANIKDGGSYQGYKLRELWVNKILSDAQGCSLFTGDRLLTVASGTRSNITTVPHYSIADNGFLTMHPVSQS